MSAISRNQRRRQHRSALAEVRRARAEIAELRRMLARSEGQLLYDCATLDWWRKQYDELQKRASEYSEYNCSGTIHVVPFPKRV